jgi:hypothetical protein
MAVRRGALTVAAARRLALHCASAMLAIGPVCICEWPAGGAESVRRKTLTSRRMPAKGLLQPRQNISTRPEEALYNDLVNAVLTKM